MRKLVRKNSIKRERFMLGGSPFSPVTAPFVVVRLLSRITYFTLICVYVQSKYFTHGKKRKSPPSADFFCFGNQKQN